MNMALKNRLKRLERRPDLSPKPTLIDRIREVFRLHADYQDAEGFETALERVIRGDGE